MKFKKPKMVCYDWDNTLVNTFPITMVSMNELYKKYGLKELTVEDIFKINGYCFADVFTAVFGKENSEQIQEEYQMIYDNYAKNALQPISGALNTIKIMHEYEIKQVVISNKPSNIVKREAEEFGFAKYLSLIIGPNDTGYAKPDIRMFNPIYENFEFKEKWHHPDKLWFFGDAEADIDFAKNINARLFFLGDSSLVNNFPLDQLVLLSGHSDIENIEFESENKNN